MKRSSVESSAAPRTRAESSMRLAMIPDRFRFVSGWAMVLFGVLRFPADDSLHGFYWCAMSDDPPPVSSVFSSASQGPRPGCPGVGSRADARPVSVFIDLLWCRIVLFD